VLINKENIPLVAMEFMNDVHMEDVDIINKLFDSLLTYEITPSEENEKVFNENYMEWFEHTIEHFRGEEIMMQEKEFPPYPMHKGEHENGLRIMDETFRHWKLSKDIDQMKNYLSVTLPAWLTHHIQTMDTVTAMFFKSGLSPCSIR